MLSKDYLMLRSAQRARLEGRKVVMQPVVSILAHPPSAFRHRSIVWEGVISGGARANPAPGGMHCLPRGGWQLSALHSISDWRGAAELTTSQ